MSILAKQKQSKYHFFEASKEDLSTIFDFTFKLHQHENDDSIKPNKNFKYNLEKWLQSEINNPRSLYIMATDSNNNHVGFIGATSILNDNGFLENPIKGLIQLIWIEPKHRSTGIAQSLIDEIEHCFKTIGIKYIECSYTANNAIAKSFWNKCGYSENSITARKILDN